MQFRTRSFLFDILQDLLMRGATAVLLGNVCGVTYSFSYDVDLMIGLGEANCKVGFRNKIVVSSGSKIR
jgi:hypothetical protein